MALSMVHVVVASFLTLCVDAVTNLGRWGNSSQRNSSQLREAVHEAAPFARGWLGRGQWVAKDDFWNMEFPTGDSIFSSELSDSCFIVEECSGVAASDFHSFESVGSWSMFYSKNFAIGLAADYDLFAATIDASIGSSFNIVGLATRKLTFAAKTFQQKCYALVTSNNCAYSVAAWSAGFREALISVPKDGPYDQETMQMVVDTFTKRFGTHLSITSSHGARLQALSSVDSRSRNASACSENQLCLDFGFVSSVSGAGNACSGSKTCDTNDDLANTITKECVAVGGDSTLRAGLCSEEKQPENVEKWATGADLDSASSITRYTYVPISEFITEADFYTYSAQAKTLKKAAEYANCKIGLDPPVQKWTSAGGCLCVRQCENGGTLDSTTCTCSCPGNVKHGSQGAECKEQYGACQPGVNTGNPTAANKCPLNNQCNSDFSKKVCKPSEVCCATNFGTTCCPFGNSCKCGSGSCTCVPP